MKKILLIEAAEAGDIEKVEALLQAGAKVNETDHQGATALIIAAERGHVAIVDKLILAGANVNAACIDISQFRRLQGGILNRLYRAHEPHVVMSFEEEAGKEGMTALMGAVNYGHGEIVRKLIAAKADVNYANWRGNTAFRNAIFSQFHQNMEIIEQLLLAGSNVNHVTRYGSSLLFAAINEGKLLIVQRMLEAGVNINYVDEEGNTALFVAVRCCDRFMAKLLILAGINVNHVNNKGHTALSLAMKLRKEEAERLAAQPVENLRNIVNIMNLEEAEEDLEEVENPNNPEGLENPENIDEVEGVEGVVNLDNPGDMENPGNIVDADNMMEAEDVEVVYNPEAIENLQRSLAGVENTTIEEIIKSALPTRKELYLARNRGSAIGFFYKDFPAAVSEEVGSFLGEKNQLMLTTRAAYQFAKEKMREQTVKFAESRMSFNIFKVRYFESYHQTFFKKENSEMFKLIKQNKIKTVDEVMAYIKRKSYSRAAHVYSQFIEEYLQDHMKKPRLKS